MNTFLDENLLRDGTTDPVVLERMIKWWQAHGFEPTETVNGNTIWKDLCVVEGPVYEWPAPEKCWLELAPDGCSAYLKGTQPGTIAMPTSTWKAPVNYKSADPTQNWPATNSLKNIQISSPRIFFISTIIWILIDYIKFYYIDPTLITNDVDYIVEGVAPYLIPVSGLILGTITTAAWKLFLIINNALTRKAR